MYNEYLAPYKAAVDAGVGSVMSSFNIVDGIPATANKWLLSDCSEKNGDSRDCWLQIITLLPKCLRTALPL